MLLVTSLEIGNDTINPTPPDNNIESVRQKRERAAFFSSFPIIKILNKDRSKDNLNLGDFKRKVNKVLAIIGAKINK